MFSNASENYSGHIFDLDKISNSLLFSSSDWLIRVM